MFSGRGRALKVRENERRTELPVGEQRGAEVFNQKSERSSGEISLLFASERQSARVLRTMMVPDLRLWFCD